MPLVLRQSTGGPASTRTELPQYEAPVFSLNPAAQRALFELQQTHNLRSLEEHLGEAIASLTNAAGDINERLTEKERNVKKRKTEHTSSQGGFDGNDEEETFQTLRDKVERMTQRMDEGLLKVIDGQWGVQSVKDSLKKAAEEARNSASTQASTQHVRSQNARRTRADIDRVDGDDEDDEEYQDFEPTDPTEATQTRAPPIDLFRSTIDTSKTRYQSRTRMDRYADNNDYRGFKSMVHQTRHPDDDIPMAHPHEWFHDGPAPAPGVTTRARAGREGEDDDDDDDIAVSRATISTKCPLTLQEFRNPLTSKKCPHSFEKDAILEMISMNRLGGRAGPRGTVVGGIPGVQCPVPGCSHELTRDDLQVDPVLIRKIKRLQRAKELEDETDDEDGGRHAHRTQGVHMIDEDDGADVDDLLDEQDHVPATQPKTERVQSSLPHATPRSTAVVNVGSSQSEAEEDDEDDDATLMSED